MNEYDKTDRFVNILLILFGLMAVFASVMIIVSYQLEKDTCNDAGMEYHGGTQCLKTLPDGRVETYQLESDNFLGLSWKINKHPSVEK